MPRHEAVPVIAVDGPVGSGKGAVSCRVAEKLGFLLLDSGALYRALALKARAHDVALDDAAALASLAAEARPRFHRRRRRESGRRAARRCGRHRRNPHRALRQRRFARLGLARGARRPARASTRFSAGRRDSSRTGGTWEPSCFPKRPRRCSLPPLRGHGPQRRHKQLMAKGVDVTVCGLSREMSERDRRDRERAVAPLRPASDAVLIDTTGLDIEAVVARVLDVYRRSMADGVFGKMNDLACSSCASSTALGVA